MSQFKTHDVTVIEVYNALTDERLNTTLTSVSSQHLDRLYHNYTEQLNIMIMFHPISSDLI